MKNLSLNEISVTVAQQIGGGKRFLCNCKMPHPHKNTKHLKQKYEIEYTNDLSAKQLCKSLCAQQGMVVHSLTEVH